MFHFGQARITLLGTMLMSLLSAAPTRATDLLEVAPFARIATWDPARHEGATAGRVEEYRAEDVYQARPLAPDAQGCYEAPADATGRRGRIGLQAGNHRLPVRSSFKSEL